MTSPLSHPETDPYETLGCLLRFANRWGRRWALAIAKVRRLSRRARFLQCLAPAFIREVHKCLGFLLAHCVADGFSGSLASFGGITGLLLRIGLSQPGELVASALL